jgi:GH25 family lysozyme M1 (1,4-beta-N-acetylmuramidase)
MPKYTLGADVSEYQGRVVWNTAVEAGLKFAYARAVVGSEIDAQFERNSSKLPNKNIHYGFYFPYQPKVDWKVQAETFCDLIEDIGWDLPPAVDVELDGDLSELSDAVLYVALRLKVPPAIYTSALFWNNNVGDPPWASMLPLWIAIWSDEIEHPWENPTYKPLSWDDFVFWQFSAGGNGRGAEFGAKSEDIDLNWFNGNKAALAEYAQQVTMMREGLILEPRIEVIETKMLQVFDTFRGLGTDLIEAGEKLGQLP